MEHFSRTELLIGKSALKRLAASSVTLIGLGAVGSCCLEALARSGVGYFRVVDFDVIKRSNINRHIWALHSTVDIPKVELARQRVKDINPLAQIETYHMFADQQTLPDILANAPNLVIDAADAANLKVQTLKTAYDMKLRVLSSMGAAMRTDLSSVKVGDLMDSAGCPLAKRMRQILRGLGVGRGIACVYSSQVVDVHQASIEAVFEPGDVARGRPRRKLGSLATVTGVFGLTLAHAAIEILLSEQA